MKYKDLTIKEHTGVKDDWSAKTGNSTKIL